MAEDHFIKTDESVNRFEIKRQGYTLAFEISPDALECRCFYAPSTIGGAPLTKPELEGYLTQFRIREGVIPEAVASLINSAASAATLNSLLLASGIPMIPGEDGQIVIGVSDGLAVKESDEEELGSIDFRHVQTFLNVDEGDLIATVKQPGTGTPGRTVVGNIIPPQVGAPLKLKIGQNVSLSEDGLSLFALATGRVCFKDGEISVTDVYEIAGDVDFKVGNISFKGYVDIKGDVLDGFFVRATKGIKINGNIGVCTIESDGDISFCGMNGQGTGSIKCGGTITANFIYDTEIESVGDVFVETEVRSSHIKSLGAISINKGGLVGGEYFALAGVECGNLGCVTSLRTRVIAGVNHADLAELNGLFNELKLLVSEFNSASRETLDMKEFAFKRAEITRRTQDVRSRTYQRCNPKINVRKTLYEGVTITLGMITDTVNGERKGPLTIIENSIEGGFRFLGMTPLSFKAQEIEQTFIRQYQLEQQKKPGEDIGETTT